MLHASGLPVRKREGARKRRREGALEETVVGLLLPVARSGNVWNRPAGQMPTWLSPLST